MNHRMFTNTVERKVSGNVNNATKTRLLPCQLTGN